MGLNPGVLTGGSPHRLLPCSAWPPQAQLSSLGFLSPLSLPLTSHPTSFSQGKPSHCPASEDLPSRPLLQRFLGWTRRRDPRRRWKRPGLGGRRQTWPCHLGNVLSSSESGFSHPQDGSDKPCLRGLMFNEVTNVKGHTEPRMVSLQAVGSLGPGDEDIAACPGPHPVGHR